MKLSFLLVFTLVIFCSNAQDYKKYSSLCSEAYDLYEKKDYLASAQKYSEAFKIMKGTSDRYNAACSWALVPVVDSAFYFLQEISIGENAGYSNYDHIRQDSDLNVLHDDPRWEEILTQIKARKDFIEKDFDHELVAQLNEIYKLDQAGRHKIKDIEKEFGFDSPELKAHWKEINHQDSINLIAIQKILDERGWLPSEIISSKGNSTLFLVIQHSDLEVQEKYLPMMREAAKRGNAHRASLALLEDRVALRQGKKQIYGSQIGRDKETGENFVLPLENPEKVDERRALMGMGALSNYTSFFDFTWDLEKHLLDTKIYEKKNKKAIKKKRKAAKKRGTY